MADAGENRIWCGGLPSDISEPELYEEFSKHGTVESVSIRSSPRDTFAFIQMAGRVDAENAISKMSRLPLWGSRGLQVRIAHNHPSTRPAAAAEEEPPPRLGSPRRASEQDPGPPPEERGRCRPHEDPRDRPHAPWGSAVATREDPRRGLSRGFFLRPDEDPFDLWADCLPWLESAALFDDPYFPPRRVPPDWYWDPRLDDRCRQYELRFDDALYDRARRSACGDVYRSCYSPSRYEPAAHAHRGEGRMASSVAPAVLRPASASRHMERSRSPGVGAERAAGPAPAYTSEAQWRAQNLSVVIEHLPPDMSWLELKNLGRVYGYVAYARTFRDRSGLCGLLEFSKQEDKERAVQALHGQTIEGCPRPLRVSSGLPPDAYAGMSRPSGDERQGKAWGEGRHRRTWRSGSAGSDSSGRLRRGGRRR